MTSLQKKREEEESIQRFINLWRHCKKKRRRRVYKGLSINDVIAKKRGEGEYTKGFQLMTSLQKKEEKESIQRFVNL